MEKMFPSETQNVVQDSSWAFPISRTDGSQNDDAVVGHLTECRRYILETFIGTCTRSGHVDEVELIRAENDDLIH